MKVGDTVFLKVRVVNIMQASGNNIVCQTNNGSKFGVSEKDVASDIVPVQKPPKGKPERKRGE